MNRAKVVLICLSLIFLSLPVSGLSGSRAQWWLDYIKKLEIEKQHLTNNGGNRELLLLLDKEVQEGRSVLALINDQDRADQKTVKYTEKQIVAAIKRSIRPLIAAEILHEMINRLAGSQALVTTRKLVDTEIARIVTQSLGRKYGFIEKNMIHDHVKTNVYKTITLERIIGNYLNSMPVLLNKYTGDVYEEILPQIRKRNYMLSDYELSEMIFSGYTATTISGELVTVNDTILPLRNCWSWQYVSVPLKRDLDLYQAVTRWLQYRNDLDGEKIVLYFVREAQLEQDLFTYLKKVCGYNKGLQDTAQPAKQGGRYIGIPERINMKRILDSIDAERRSMIDNLRNIDRRNLVQLSSRKFNKLIFANTIHITKVYKKGEKQLSAVKAGKTADESREILNEKKFISAYKRYKRNLGLLEQYKRYCIEYLEWLKKKSINDYDYIVEINNVRVKRSDEYLALLQELVKVTQEMDIRFCDRKRYRTILAGKKHVINIIKYMGYANSIEQQYIAALDRQQVSVIRNNRSKMQKNLIGAARIISGSYRLFVKNYRDYFQQKKENELSIKNDIAQYEINVLSSLLNDYAVFYKGLIYDKKVITQYAEQYTRFREQVYDGLISPELDRCIRQNSLFAANKDFDRKRLIQERESKRFLKNHLRSSMVRLQSLLSYYKRKKIPLLQKPAPEQFSHIIDITRGRYSQKVAYWNMNDYNLFQIDKKVTRHLQSLIHKKEMQSGLQDHYSGKIVNENINGLRISLQLPGGWYRDTAIRKDRDYGSVIVFRSADNAYTLSLYSVPAKVEKGPVLAKKIMTKVSGPYIEKRWENITGTDYFWLLSRDEQKNVCESYTFSKQGYHIVLIGKTTKIRYSHYNEKLRELISTIQ